MMVRRAPQRSKHEGERFSLKLKRLALYTVCLDRLLKPISRTESYPCKTWRRRCWRWPMAKVLVVDDSAMSRRILKDILISDGHDVIEAQDGLTALEVYFLQKPEVVMLDLIMKEMYGIEVLKKIRELDRNARVIVASADI